MELFSCKYLQEICGRWIAVDMTDDAGLFIAADTNALTLAAANWDIWRRKNLLFNKYRNSDDKSRELGAFLKLQCYHERYCTLLHNPSMKQKTKTKHVSLFVW